MSILTSPALRWVKPSTLLTCPAGAVLWLPGQDDAYSTTIRDRSGKNNNGTITGATWARLPSGLWVLNFDGDDLITVPSLAAQVTQKFSIAVWVIPAALITGTFIGGQVSPTLVGYDWGLYLTANPVLYVVNAAGVEVSAACTVPAVVGSPALLVGTYDGAFLRIYRNGKLDAAPVAQTGNLRNSGYNFVIGKWFNRFALTKAMDWQVSNDVWSDGTIAEMWNTKCHLYGA